MLHAMDENRTSPSPASNKLANGAATGANHHHHPNRQYYPLNETTSSSFREDACLSFRDMRATAFTLDASERYAALVGRRDVVVCDLTTGVIERRFSRVNNKWECACAAWSRQRPTENLIATASNNKLEFFDAVHGAASSKVSITSGHSRHITDIDWSPESHVLASSSADCYIMVYDLRESKPRAALNSVTSVSQVKFNHTIPYLLASAHEGQIKLWDLRQTSGAYSFLTAHTSRIYGLEWSRKDNNLLLSSSQDGMCKLWDTAGDSDKALLQLHIGLPVWRARFAPFAVQSVATVVLSSAASGGGGGGRGQLDAVQFWNLEDTKTPVAVLPSSTMSMPTANTAAAIAPPAIAAVDSIIDCAWRTNSTTLADVAAAPSACKFLTFSKGSVLRSWRIDASLQVALGADMSVAADADEDDDDDDGDVPVRLRSKRSKSGPISADFQVVVATPTEKTNDAAAGILEQQSDKKSVESIKSPSLVLADNIKRKLKSFFHPSFDAELARELLDEQEQQEPSARESNEDTAKVVEHVAAVVDFNEAKKIDQEMANAATADAKHKYAGVLTDFSLLDFVSTTATDGAQNSTILSIHARTALHEVRMRLTFTASATVIQLPAAVNYLKGTSLNQTARLDLRSHIISQATDTIAVAGSSGGTVISTSPIVVYIMTLADAVVRLPASASALVHVSSSSSNMHQLLPPMQQDSASVAAGSPFRASSASMLHGTSVDDDAAMLQQQQYRRTQASTAHRTLSTVVDTTRDDMQLNASTGRFSVRRVDEALNEHHRHQSRAIMGGGSLSRTNSSGHRPVHDVAVDYHIKPRVCGLAFTWYGLLAFSDSFDNGSSKSDAANNSSNSYYSRNMLFNFDNTATLADSGLVAENDEDDAGDNNDAGADDDVDGLHKSFAAYFHPGAAAFLNKKQHLHGSSSTSSSRTLTHGSNATSRLSKSIRAAAAITGAQQHHHRSLRSLGGAAGAAILRKMDGKFGVSSSRYNDMQTRNAAGGSAMIAFMYDLTALLPIRRDLSAYKMTADNNSSNFHAACKYNEFIATNAVAAVNSTKTRSLTLSNGANGEPLPASGDLGAFWQLFDLSATPELLHKQQGVNDVCNWSSSWSQHPLSGKLLSRLLEHYEQRGDIQTVATAVSLLPYELSTTTDDSVFFPGGKRSKNVIMMIPPAPPPPPASYNTLKLPPPPPTNKFLLPSVAAAAAQFRAFGGGNSVHESELNNTSRSPPSTNHQLKAMNVNVKKSSPSVVDEYNHLNNSVQQQRTLISHSTLLRYLPLQMDYCMQLYCWMALVARREMLKSFNLSTSTFLMCRADATTIPISDASIKKRNDVIQQQQHDRYVAVGETKPSVANTLMNKSQQKISNTAAATMVLKPHQNVRGSSVGGSSGADVGILTTTNTYSNSKFYSTESPHAAQRQLSSESAAFLRPMLPSTTVLHRSQSQMTKPVMADTSDDEHRAIKNNDFLNRCDFCGKLGNTNGPHCVRCHRFLNYCSVCRLPVRGLLMFCTQCGHCGHAGCMREWFVVNMQTTCPRACLCNCTMTLSSSSTTDAVNKAANTAESASVVLDGVVSWPSSQQQSMSAVITHQQNRSPHHHHHHHHQRRHPNNAVQKIPPSNNKRYHDDVSSYAADLLYNKNISKNTLAFPVDA